MISIIVMADMHIRDERVLEWVKARCEGGECRVKAHEIAEAFKCHPITARAIMKRLARAGYLTIERTYRRGGYLCRIA